MREPSHAGSRPDGYPVDCEADVVLADGRVVHVRPVVPDDAAELAKAIARADRETLRLRFLGGAPPSSPSALARLVTVDYVRRFALAAFDSAGTGVGIARYEGETTWPAVDVAVAVEPAWRGVGLGRELVTRVVQQAARHGAQRLTADFFVDNGPVQNLLAEAGLPEQRTLDRGVVADVVRLDGAALARQSGAGS